jgi:hypothetical protein
MKLFLHVGACALVLMACGGGVVVDDGEPGQSSGQGGQGATGASGSGASGATGASGTGASGPASVSSTGTGGDFCDDHGDCGAGRVCLFGAGVCAAACGGDYCETCETGTICSSCATSSCPDCLDCLGACVPTPPGACDENDPCPPESVCVFAAQQCAPKCIATGTGCAEPGLYCTDCVTGSCCGCDDCVPACWPLEG